MMLTTILIINYHKKRKELRKENNLKLQEEERKAKQEENNKIINNSIDLIPIIWQNIILEVPLKVIDPNFEAKNMSGDGWRFVTEEKDIKSENNNTTNDTLLRLLEKIFLISYLIIPSHHPFHRNNIRTHPPMSAPPQMLQQSVAHRQ